jgi:hypothetical protein
VCVREREPREHTDLEHENLLAVLFGHLLGQAISARERRGGRGGEGGETRAQAHRERERGREGERERGREGERERGREGERERGREGERERGRELRERRERETEFVSALKTRSTRFSLCHACCCLGERNRGRRNSRVTQNPKP